MRVSLVQGIAHLVSIPALVQHAVLAVPFYFAFDFPLSRRCSVMGGAFIQRHKNSRVGVG